jgi:putative glutamine amidotransferase
VHSVRIGITSTPILHDGHALHSINRAFVDAVVGAGAVPVVLPVLEPELAPGSLEGIDGLLLSGGGDVDPAIYGETAVPEVDQVDVGRDRFEMALVRAALDRGMPVLGVCRGHQVLNVALGGRLIQHVPHLTEVSHQEKGRAGDLIHTVQVDPGSLVAELLGGELVGVNTLHHQAVAEAGDGLVVVAWSTEDGLMEAVEHVDRPVIGVQWHPELLQHHPEHRRLFRWLVDEGERWRAEGPHAASGETGETEAGGSGTAAA